MRYIVHGWYIVYVLSIATRIPKNLVGGLGAVEGRYSQHNADPSSELRAYRQADNRMQGNSIIIPMILYYRYQSQHSKVHELYTIFCTTVLVKDLILYISQFIPSGSKVGFLSQRFLPQQGSSHPLFRALLVITGIRLCREAQTAGNRDDQLGLSEVPLCQQPQ